MTTVTTRRKFRPEERLWYYSYVFVWSLGVILGDIITVLVLKVPLHPTKLHLDVYIVLAMIALFACIMDEYYKIIETRRGATNA